MIRPQDVEISIMAFSLTSFPHMTLVQQISLLCCVFKKCRNDCYKDIGLSVYLMVFNATFNNISVIKWRSAKLILVEETGGPGEKHHIMLYTSP